MTAQNAFFEVNSILPHNFDTKLLLIWLNRIEKTVAVEIEEIPVHQVLTINEELLAEPLRIPEPYSFIYPLYLQCMIYLSLGEYDRYANVNSLFNSIMSDYAKWYLKNGGKNG